MKKKMIAFIEAGVLALVMTAAAGCFVGGPGWGGGGWGGHGYYHGEYHHR